MVLATVNEKSNLAYSRELFSSLLKNQGIGDLALKENNKIKVKQLCHPLGWLPDWMIRSDEISMLLFNKRLWNVVYVAQEKTPRGLTVIDMNEYTGSSLPHNYEAYDHLHSDDDSVSLKALIAKEAISQSLDIQDNQVAIKPLLGFYGLKRRLQHNEVFPLANRALIGAYQFHRFNVAIAKQKLIKKYDHSNHKPEQENLDLGQAGPENT